MSKNKKSENGRSNTPSPSPSRQSGTKQLNDDVRGGYNPPTSEQKPSPPAKPPAKK